MRDFAGMGGWHEDITKMHMLGGARPDKVSGVRDFYFGAGHLSEELHLCDRTRSFSYRIMKSEIPWINYVSGPRLWPVTAGNTTFAVWTGDWDASSRDDQVLIANRAERLPKGPCNGGAEAPRQIGGTAMPNDAAVFSRNEPKPLTTF